MVIICKLFEVMKSHIKILFVDCSAHLHTLIENKKSFECYHFRRKQKEGPGHQEGKTHFWGQKEISGRWVAGGPKIWPDEKFLSIDTPLKAFLI